MILVFLDDRAGGKNVVFPIFHSTSKRVDCNPAKNLSGRSWDGMESYLVSIVVRC